MDNLKLWQRYQDWLYYNEDLGFYLDISRITFDDALIAELKPKFDKAFKDIEALEGGAIANPDENRMVGHYWLRDPDLAPTDELKQDIIDTNNSVLDFTQKVHSGAVKPPSGGKFTDILSIGIGGSALGPQFVAQALAPNEPPLRIHFIDNTDPAGIDKVIAGIDDLSTTLVSVISKSGGTPETRNGMLEVKKVYTDRNLDFAAHAFAITGKSSKLEAIAEREGWLAIFPMRDWVGGRTSELSPVGLVAAALQGIDIRAMLEGAKTMDALTRKHSLQDNPAALLAMAWYAAGHGRGEKDMVILPYKDSLLLFSRYLQQLIMESLGKEKDLDGNVVSQGIAVYGNKGSTDQHAYVQQLREGVNNFFLTFIEVLEDRTADFVEIEPGITSGDYLKGFLLGTRTALNDKQRDSITITIPKVNERVVGALIALYERTVSIYASLVNINAYHQPGVEAGKKAAASVLDIQKQVVATLKETSSPLSLEELANKAGIGDEIETVYKIVRHLDANKRGIAVQGHIGEPSTIKASWKS
ncbi:glucose-6-phosphate isomerase [Waterburya agarophytonicola K14]|uniref:Glucose-6-phosphate isomerase n=1 Tax=Waterburya agarophytonicola KI4 TaxID=2874699 RepID=A0A964BNN8_9CYAN|nr:glucose-6-phosphate isomerase [Waterburya agarophytonicola]MCC0175688.1 glucose-6-phosphate isomerase [Waterburya agarophytonicola KI4]